MDDPVLVEVTRGDKVESLHRGAVAVCDADGALLMSLGDIDRPVFPRSAVKSMQALLLVESGAATALDFGDRELALACASHSGEPLHVSAVSEILDRLGLDPTALECGAHWPSDQKAMVELAGRRERPSALHNNCSGKHASFLCVCRQSGIDPHGYVDAGHWLQQSIRGVMAEVTGYAHNAANRGIDGCSIPTYAVPLRNLAHGFARMVTGSRLGAARAAAAKRLLQACMAEPFFTSGTGRMDATLMEVAPGRIFVKTGAEGVYCAAVPDLGAGIALKCDDGAGRAAEVAIAAVLAKLLASDEELAARLDKIARPVLSNWNGIEVGALRPGGALV